MIHQWVQDALTHPLLSKLQPSIPAIPSPHPGATTALLEAAVPAGACGAAPPLEVTAIFVTSWTTPLTFHHSRIKAASKGGRCIKRNCFQLCPFLS